MMTITYHSHSCFQLEDATSLFLFDWYGEALPQLDGSKEIYILNSHKHADHYNPVLQQLADRYASIHFLWSREIKMPRDDARFVPLKRGAIYPVNDRVTVETLASTDIGVAFLVHYDTMTIYHAGDLNWWHWPEEGHAWNRNMECRFQEIMEALRGRQIDYAFVPLDPRMGEHYALGFDYFLSLTDCSHVFPMHLWGQMDTVARWKSQCDRADWNHRVVALEAEGQQMLL